MSSTQQVYVSHPMSGRTQEQMAEQMEQAASHLIAAGKLPMFPVNIAPWDHPGQPCPEKSRRIVDDPHAVACYLRADLAALLECDGVLMMPGWEGSAGCLVEFNVAVNCGIPISLYNH